MLAAMGDAAASSDGSTPMTDTPAAPRLDLATP